MATLIVGAGKGIGFEVVKQYIEKYPGEKIIAISRNIEKLLPLAKKSKSLTVIKCDISSNKDLERLRREIAPGKMKIRYVINLAGVLVKKDWQELSEADFDAVFHNNVYGPFNLIKTIYPLLEKNSGGHIVNIGSMGGVEGTQKFPGMIFYSSSKAALATLTECLAEELKDIGFHVNCVALGAVETEMKKKAFPGHRAPHTAAQVAAWLVRFLSEDRDYFNGKVIKLAVSTP